MVDLRQHSQFVRTAGFLPPENTAHVQLVDQVIDTDAPPPLESAADFADLYDGMLDASREPMASALDQIADQITTTPVLVHCSFGKDRAGLLTALVQAAIGVTRESIVVDYARSDGPALRRYDWMLREPWPGDVDLHTVPTAIFRAHAETMEILLERLVERHGSLAAWVDTFPVHPDTIERLGYGLREEPRDGP